MATPTYRWECVTDQAPFAPRDGAGALVFAGRMWLLGGWNPLDMDHFPRTCNNEVWSSAGGRDWALVKPNTFHNTGRTFNRLSDWAGRHTAGYAVHRDRMWIVGGDANQGHYHNDVWASTDGGVWHYTNPGKPVPWRPRCLHHTVVFRDRIWIMGGQTLPQFAEAAELFYNDVWCSEDGIRWEQATRDAGWAPRGGIGGSVVFQDRVWVLGGAIYGTPGSPGGTRYNDVWSSADGIRWRREVETAPWRPRAYHDVAVFDDRMWVLEGAVDGTNSNEVWHSADGVTWTELTGTPWKPRHAASVFVYGNALWMVAGNNMESDVWRLTRRSAGVRA